MKIRSIGLIFYLTVILTFPAYATPLSTIEKHVGSILEVLRGPALKTEEAGAERQDKIRKISEQMFNYMELSKRTLARNWRNFNKKQRAEFAKARNHVVISRLTCFPSFPRSP